MKKKLENLFYIVLFLLVIVAFIFYGIVQYSIYFSKIFNF